MNAPSGNLNAATFGRTIVAESRQGIRYALPAPRLTKAYRYIAKRVDSFRRELEDAVAACKAGQIDLHDACLISAACDHERARQFLMARLRDVEESGDKQPLAILAQVVQTVGRCVDARNKCISGLGISADHQRKDSLASLYSSEPVDSVAYESTEADDNAADAALKREEGD